jgi:hypothetical protein
MGPICNECRQIDAINNQATATRNFTERQQSNQTSYSSLSNSAYYPSTRRDSNQTISYVMIVLFVIAIVVSAHNDGSFWHFIVSLFSFLRGIMSGILWVIGFCLGIKVEMVWF